MKFMRTLTLSVHLVHAPSFWWSPSCSFTFVILFVLYLSFDVLCCVCLFSMSGLSFSVSPLHSFDLRYNLGPFDYSFNQM